MSWSNDYIGLPYVAHGRSRAGVDCWGLAVLVYREVLGIELPTYTGYASPDERAEVAALVDGATESPLWQAVPAGEAQPFDVVLCRYGALQSHVGVLVTPGPRQMLHMLHDAARIESLQRPPWRDRVCGY